VLLNSCATSSSYSSSPEVPPSHPHLTEDQVCCLEYINFEWKVNPHAKRFDQTWDQMFNRLMWYRYYHGHLLVPRRYAPDLKLSAWVHSQRYQYRKYFLGQDKKPHGTTKKTTSAFAWAAAEDDNDNNGSLEDNDEKAKRSPSRLTDARRQRLDEIGFVWSVRPRTAGGAARKREDLDDCDSDSS
jgi:hypothetical protein